MAQIFHRSANTLSRVTIFGAIFIVGFVLWVIGGIVRSPYFTNQGIEREQPVPFSHQHHVGGPGHRLPLLPHLGRDVELRRHPADADLHELPLADLDERRDARAGARQLRHRTSRSSGAASTGCRTSSTSITRIHVAKGIGCASCHGRIDKMPLTYQASPLTMEWCLSCHRAPEKFVRPRNQVFNMAYVAKNQESSARSW